MITSRGQVLPVLVPISDRLAAGPTSKRFRGKRNQAMRDKDSCDSRLPCQTHHARLNRQRIRLLHENSKNNRDAHASEGIVLSVADARCPSGIRF